MDAKAVIACRVAQEMQDGFVVNLGIGTPTLVPNYVSPEIHVTLQSENGFLGMGPLNGETNANIVNAGGQPCGLQPGAAIFDSLTAKHIDLLLDALAGAVPEPLLHALARTSALPVGLALAVARHCRQRQQDNRPGHHQNTTKCLSRTHC